MKKILILLIVTLFFSCTNQEQKKENLGDSPVIKKVFNEKEIASLNQLLDFFDGVVRADANQSIDSAYRDFFTELDQTNSYDPLIDKLKVNDAAQLKKLLAQLKEDGVCQVIWYPDVKDENIDPRFTKDLQIDIQGKYMELLRLLENDNPFFKQYLIIMKREGGGSPGITGNMVKNWYKEVDFNNKAIRLVWAIYYITETSDYWLN